MSDMTMIALHNCGDIKAGRYYKVLERGQDWYLTKINGKARYVYSWVFDVNPLKCIKEEIAHA